VPRPAPIADWGRLRRHHPRLDRELRDITTAQLEEVLRPIADTHAPSQTSSVTRGDVIASRLAGRAPGLTVERNLAGSGCDVIRSRRGGLRIVAHLDEISYLVAGSSPDARGWPLVPFCYHLADGPRPAVILRPGPDGRYAVVGRGQLDGPPDAVRFRGDEGVDPQAGDRILLPAPLAVDQQTGIVTGSLDNAAGVAAALVATEALHRLDVPVELVLTDEEEGPAGASTQTIARGAARVQAVLDPAPLTVVVDVHGLPPDHVGHRTPFGASLAEFSSSGRGAVTPPSLFRAIRHLFDDAADVVHVTTNLGGHVPRSDDVVATLSTPAVCLVGYPGSNRHFDHGLPTANLHDLAALARALVVLAAAVASREAERDVRAPATTGTPIEETHP
jgi:hypothetical protein